MISKQLMAFFAGVTMVVACAGAFLLYDQHHGDDIQADADNGSGDTKTTNDPASGFTSYDGQHYYIHYGGVSQVSSSNTTFNTNYIMELDTDVPKLVTGYVDNIQVQLSNNSENALCLKGHNKFSISMRYTDAANSGLALVKQMQFVFTPLEEKSDINFTRTTHNVEASSENPYPYSYYTLDYPTTVLAGVIADVYVGNIYVTTITLSESGTTSLTSTNSYYGDYTNSWMIIGSSIYQVTMA